MDMAFQDRAETPSWMGVASSLERHQSGVAAFYSGSFRVHQE